MWSKYGDDFFLVLFVDYVKFGNVEYLQVVWETSVYFAHFNLISKKNVCK